MADGLLRKLNQNLMVSVQVGRDEDAPRYRAILYGSVGDEFLMIGGLETPVVSAGAEIIVRMVIEGQALAFRSTVESVVESPKRLLFAGFPTEAATADLRKAERINVFVPADPRAEAGLNGESKTMMLKTIVVNLGSGGCCVSTKQPLEAETEISVSFALPGETHIHSVTGMVIGRTRKDSGYVVRVKFPKISENVLPMGDISRWVTQYAPFGQN